MDARVQTLDMVKADKETIQIEIDLVSDFNGIGVE